MTKITAEHLRRTAYVYVRQSTVNQLQHHPESRHRQYALEQLAQALSRHEVSHD